MAQDPIHSPRSRPQFSDDAASFVRDLIMSGRLRPGEFIRQERIASLMGISSTPVREGLLLLRGEGVVRLEPRRGFVVADLTGADVEDMFWTQSVLAGELAARAAVNIDEAGIARLWELEGRVRELARDGSSGGETERANHALHRAINLSARSPKIAWLLSVGARYIPGRYYSTIPDWPQTALDDHREMVEAIAKRDGETARLVVQRHIAHAGELLASHLTGLSEAQENELRAESMEGTDLRF